MATEISLTESCSRACYFFSVGSKNLWPHKVGSRVENYSARWKFMLISDQAKDFVKNCVEGGGSMSPFSTASLHPGS